MLVEVYASNLLHYGNGILNLDGVHIDVIDLLADNEVEFNIDCCHEADEARKNDEVESKAHVRDTKSSFI